MGFPGFSAVYLFDAAAHPGLQGGLVRVGEIRSQPVDIFAGLIQRRDNVVMNADAVMDIGPADQLFLPEEPVVDLNPDIGAAGKFA